MGNHGFKELQFVQVIDGGLPLVGIIADFNAEPPETAKTVNVMFAEMPDDFGTYNIELEKLKILSDHEIRERVELIGAEYEEYPYFIIQLNDIEELSEYHLPENEFLREIRTTDEVLND